MPNTSLAAIYCRVSLDRTGEGLAVERQEQSCRQLAAARGWTVTEVLTDNSISAAGKVERPGFKRLVELIESGRVQVVIAWAVDRLTRSLTDLEKLIVLAEQHSVAIATVSGDMDLSTDQGRMVARILASVARGEIERKSARQRAANDQAARAGKRRGGRRPFGYEADGVTVRPDEATAIRGAFRDLLAGVSLGEIARQWNAAGLRTGQGSPWRHDSLGVVLTNPRYVGERAHNGEVVARAEWPAIVEPDTFAAVQAMLSDPSRRRAPHGGRTFLSGLALCGVCADGTKVHCGGGRENTRVLRCKGPVSHLCRAAEPVEDYVNRVIVARLSRPDARQLLLTRDDVPDVQALRDESLAVRARLDQLALEFADGSLTASQLRTASERMQSRLSALDDALADAGRVDVLGELIDSTDLEATWQGMPVGRRRAVLSELATVTILPPGRGVRTFRPETVLIDWR